MPKKRVGITFNPYNMKSKKENEELKSRRDFFKDAAKKTLPILGALVLSGIPTNLSAKPEQVLGCQYGCTVGCTGCTGCTAECGGCTGCTGCTGNCFNNCFGICKESCKHTCKGDCTKGCHGWTN